MRRVHKEDFGEQWLSVADGKEKSQRLAAGSIWQRREVRQKVLTAELEDGTKEGRLVDLEPFRLAAETVHRVL